MRLTSRFTHPLFHPFIKSSSIITWLYISNSSKYTEFFNRQPSILKWLHWNLLLWMLVFQFVVVVIWWGVLSVIDLSHGNPLNLTLDINIHTLGIPLPLVELLLSRIPIFASQWTGIFGASLLYLLLCLLVHALHYPYWAYPFLDYTQPFWEAWYFGLFAGAILLFFMFYGIARLRDILAESLLIKTNKDLARVDPRGSTWDRNSILASRLYQPRGSQSQPLWSVDVTFQQKDLENASEDRDLTEF